MDNSNGVIADGSAYTVVSDDVEVAERALAEYDLAPDSTLRLLNLSENATYAVEDAATGTRSILRVHRQNYHQAHEIESELDWLDALRRDSDVTVPTVLPARDGRRVVTVDVDGIAAPRRAFRDGRRCRTRRGDADRRGLPHPGPR